MSPTPKQKYWLDHILNAKAQGKNLAAYARQEDISLKSLYGWKCLLKKNGLLTMPEKSGDAFVKVVPVTKRRHDQEKSFSSADSCAQIKVCLPNGVQFFMPSLSHEMLLQLVAL